MIGNDIIDLKAARKESRADELRFWKKILNPEELDRYLSGGSSPGEHLWVFWAAKESAYKLERRFGRSRRFCPKSYTVRPEQNAVGGPGGTYSMKTFGTSAFLHVCCRQNPLLTLFCRIADRNAPHLTWPPDWVLKKLPGGALIACHRNTGLNLPVSKSHHGRFQAFAWPSFTPHGPTEKH